MAKKKPFALRLSEPVMQAMRRWADDDLRSLNAQIEWVLREALKDRGRLKSGPAEPAEDQREGDEPND
ncbi:MAG: Arc family DNA-binding protein [Wenzhouxiangellaceae bacterium]